MAKLSIEQWAIERVLPYAKNARLHSDQQIEFLAESMKEFGFVNPCLTDQDGTLIAGHGRVLAAKFLGMKTVPVIRLANRLRIADNRIHDLSTWDEGLLREVLTMIKDEGLPLPPLGFDLPSFEEFLAAPNAGQADPDAAPEPKKNPAVRLGDLWVLGSHRLLCGDSTKAEDVARVIDKARPNLMVTDPPYGVEYDADWRNSAQRKNGKYYGGRAIGKVHNDDRDDWTDAYKLFPGNVAYVWHGALHVAEVKLHLASLRLLARALIVWNKNNFAVSRGHYHWKHETCWYAVREGANANWCGDRSQTTVWDIDKPQKSETGHSTQKPIACMQRPIENNSRKGESIYEPFSGSGTTIIACEITGRKAIAIEIDPAYVQVAIERWMKFSGKIATLDGVSFDDVAKERKEYRSEKVPNVRKRSARASRRPKPMSSMRVS